MNKPKYIKAIKRGVVCCGLLFVLLLHCHAEQKVIEETSCKPMMFYFRFGKSPVDSEYMDNSRMLRHLDRLLTDRNLCAHIDSINIYSFASPEGNHIYNNEKNFPYREEALQIIDCNKGYEQYKTLLNRGTFYGYMHEHMLQYPCSTDTCMIWIKPDKISKRSEVVRINPDTLKTGLQQIPQLTNEKNITPSELPEKRRRPLFALKTNLLFDAALMTNVEIEIPIGKRWSINGEYVFPWWLLENNEYCLEILSGGLEGRYWLGSSQSREHRKVLTGHFAGIYAGGGKYDLQWKENGYQGEFFIAAGISYGWATSIARNLHLELSIGVGLLRTDYRHYHARNNYHNLVWQENGNYTWFGPTKVKISLVWLLNYKAKKGNAR
ncbi:MAG: DUF3575 domain-containing protein [Bacteroides oleiciplenus]|nr:DUF3575 domain-containing protein [Bacteroides oleiciplenus]